MSAPKYPPFLDPFNLVDDSPAINSAWSTNEGNLIGNNFTDITASFFRAANPGVSQSIFWEVDLGSQQTVNTFAIHGHTFDPSFTWRLDLYSVFPAQTGTSLGFALSLPIDDYYAAPTITDGDPFRSSIYTFTEVVDGALVPKDIAGVRTVRFTITSPAGDEISGKVGMLWAGRAIALVNSRTSAAVPGNDVMVHGDRAEFAYNGGVSAVDTYNPKGSSCGFEVMSAQDKNDMEKALQIAGTQFPVMFIPKPWLPQQRDQEDAGGVVRFTKPFQSRIRRAQKDQTTGDMPDQYTIPSIQYTEWK